MTDRLQQRSSLLISPLILNCHAIGAVKQNEQCRRPDAGKGDSYYGGSQGQYQQCQQESAHGSQYGAQSSTAYRLESAVEDQSGNQQAGNSQHQPKQIVLSPGGGQSEIDVVDRR